MRIRYTFLISRGLYSYKDISVLGKMQFKLMAGYDTISINKETSITLSVIPILKTRKDLTFDGMKTIAFYKTLKIVCVLALVSRCV